MNGAACCGPSSGTGRAELSCAGVHRRTAVREHADVGVAEAIGIAVVVCLMALALWAVVDAALRPRSAWQAVGRSKALWIAGMLIGSYFVAGLILVLLY